MQKAQSSFLKSHGLSFLKELFMWRCASIGPAALLVVHSAQATNATIKCGVLSMSSHCEHFGLVILKWAAEAKEKETSSVDAIAISKSWNYQSLTDYRYHYHWLSHLKKEKWPGCRELWLGEWSGKSEVLSTRGELKAGAVLTYSS